LNQLKFFYQFY
jgi:RNA-binding protein 23/39